MHNRVLTNLSVMKIAKIFLLLYLFLYCTDNSLSQEIFSSVVMDVSTSDTLGEGITVINLINRTSCKSDKNGEIQIPCNFITDSLLFLHVDYLPLIVKPDRINSNKLKLMQNSIKKRLLIGDNTFSYISDTIYIRGKVHIDQNFKNILLNAKIFVLNSYHQVKVDNNCNYIFKIPISEILMDSINELYLLTWNDGFFLSIDKISIETYSVLSKKEYYQDILVSTNSDFITPFKDVFNGFKTQYEKRVREIENEKEILYKEQASLANKIRELEEMYIAQKDSLLEYEQIRMLEQIDSLKLVYEKLNIEANDEKDSIQQAYEQSVNKYIKLLNTRATWQSDSANFNIKKVNIKKDMFELFYLPKLTSISSGNNWSQKAGIIGINTNIKYLFYPNTKNTILKNSKIKMCAIAYFSSINSKMLNPEIFVGVIPGEIEIPKHGTINFGIGYGKGYQFTNNNQFGKVSQMHFHLAISYVILPTKYWDLCFLSYASQRISLKEGNSNFYWGIFGLKVNF